MKYSAPILQEVGYAATLVLGIGPGDGDGGVSGETLNVALAVGIDD